MSDNKKNIMIDVRNVSKEFKKVVKESGFKGSVKSLFNKKVRY